MLRVTKETKESPFRAAGTFTGASYVERGADRALRQEIQANQRYPYIVAARQSGKSSVLVRTMEALDPEGFRVALVDLSTFALTDYGEFWRRFLGQIARSAKIEATEIDPDQPDDTFLAWLGRGPERLVIFVDEIDALLGAPFRDLFFSKIRSLFNQRATEKELRRLQFVLAGATHPTRLIQDHMRSPFNVGIEIELDDLSLDHLRAIAAHLEDAGAAVDSAVAERIHQFTGGSVYLCQLVLEQLWNAAAGKERVGIEAVEAVVSALVEGAPRNIHFGNIHELVVNNRRLLDELGRLQEGLEIPERSRQDLRLTGLSNGRTPFRNEVYRRVFGEGGPLDLVKFIRAAPPLEAASLPTPAAAKEPRPPPAPAPLSASPSVSFAPPVLKPAYPDEKTRVLSEQMEAARERKKALEIAGFASEGVEGEILDLRRKLREGGQLRAGDALGDGRYLLLKQVGRGGFATVWQAQDRSRNEQVAIKVLHSELAADATRRERFLRGARTLASLDHPAVVRVLEPHGEDGGYAYCVMELVVGGDLKQAVIARRFDRTQLIGIILRVSDALAAAHARGMVHRDVKPSNILLDAAGAPRLTDFDLIMVPETTGGTRTGALGTFVYAAPEALQHPENATAAADVFGLGMTLLYSLWGKELPLDAVRDPGTLIDALTCGSGVKAVLRKALAWEPEQRFKDAAEFGKALEEASARKSEEMPRVAPDMPMHSPSPASELKKAPVPARVRSKWVVALVVAVLSLSILDLGWERLPVRLSDPNIPVEGSGTARLPATATEMQQVRGTANPIASVGIAPIAPPGSATGGSRTVPLDACPSEMELVRGGMLRMGPSTPQERGPEEDPSQAVRVETFCIDRTEVTVAAYRACVDAPACSPTETSKSVLCNGEKTDASHPINCVTWQQASSYCAWANKALPTEAQWAYAARGDDLHRHPWDDLRRYPWDDLRRYPWGDSLDDPGHRLNACDEQCARLVKLLGGPVKPLGKGVDDGWETTAPVGSYPSGASPFGVLDMAGNVAEWPQEGGVVRGGSWRDSDPKRLTVSFRSKAPPEVPSPMIGFRCAISTRSTDTPRIAPSAPPP